MRVHQDGAVSTTFTRPQFRRRYGAMLDNIEQEQRRTLCSMNGITVLTPKRGATTGTGKDG